MGLGILFYGYNTYFVKNTSLCCKTWLCSHILDGVLLISDFQHWQENTFCTIIILQSFWFHLHDLQNQNCLLVTLQNDNHSSGPGSGRLVPSSHQRTILGTFSRGDKRVWQCIPIPNGLWGKATLTKFSISNGDLICHRMMIPAAPNQRIRSSVSILALPFSYIKHFSLLPFWKIKLLVKTVHRQLWSCFIHNQYN